jgi:hypothetical protein
MKEYQNLIAFATKGDMSSLSTLFSLGEQVLADGKFEEAAKIFRESACCYRISAFRNDAKAQDLALSEGQLLSTRDIYLEWIGSHASGLLQTFPIKAEGITRDFILTCLRDDLWNDQTMSNLLAYIETSLEKHGMEFFSPGGSPLRRIVGQLYRKRPSPPYRQSCY